MNVEWIDAPTYIHEKEHDDTGEDDDEDGDNDDDDDDEEDGEQGASRYIYVAEPS